MLVDTHCHINIIVKHEFDIPLTDDQIQQAQPIITQAQESQVHTILNVGTSLLESKNCIALAQKYEHCFAAVGIHPNDLSDSWQKDLKVIETELKKATRNKIVAIGECGIDKHYPDYNLSQQVDAFKAHIELALKYNLALVVHTRNAKDETLSVLEAYRNDIKRGVIHCFSEDRDFARTVISWNFAIGLGGTITYPKNNELRQVAQQIPLSAIVLETDAPYLPPQPLRGKRNEPAYIALIAQYLADLRKESIEHIAKETTENAYRIFQFAS